MTLEGSRFIIKTTVLKASSQNFSGMEAWARRVSPFQQCGDVSAQLTHFADEHEGKKHDDQCLYA